MNRKEQAEEIAEKFATSFLQDEYGQELFTGGQIEKILAEKANIIYQYVEDEKYFGAAITHDNGEQFIAVNTYHPLRTRYFTVAHELWHLTNIVPFDPDFDHERAADRFAAAVMLPKTLVKKMWDRFLEMSDEESSIIYLSDFAQVPYLTTVRRVKELGLKMTKSLESTDEKYWIEKRTELGLPYAYLDESVKETRFKAYENVVKQNVEHVGLDSLIAANKLAKFAPQQAKQYQEMLSMGVDDCET
ncbi:ImmA/IrrE family metallo-endopeptidase [Lysinibacillus sp. NPDC094403]|uniref:ImmA/IrrE family metallo-endopeptidase n=1 Tax=Lysinibacillus sp. NPDC094403 TaxID=3390581 RepID=UPI003D091ADC